MAATDKTYRDQLRLDVIFAVSSILMLISVVMMFMQDYYREFKDEQRVFRDVESRLAQRLALEQIPDEDKMADAEAKVEEAKAARQEKEPDVRNWRKQMEELRPTKEKRDATVNSINADLGSILTIYYIEVEHHGKNSDHAVALKKQIDDLETKQAKAVAERDDTQSKMMQFQRQIDQADRELNDAVGKLKQVNERFDAAVKMAINKQWGWGDWIRTWPVIDGFASPTRIH